MPMYRILFARLLLASLFALAACGGSETTSNNGSTDVAIDAGADIIGVNNRDLTELEVDLATFEAVAPSVPENVTLIAESGIATPDDVARMRAAGADALLVGSAIMEGDVTENTRELTTTETT
jgi:indole-3-glycerol phosphate synthase